MSTKTVDGGDGQGTGSMTIVDSDFLTSVFPIITHTGSEAPGLVLDNIFVHGSLSIVSVIGGAGDIARPAGRTVDDQVVGHGHAICQQGRHGPQHDGPHQSCFPTSRRVFLTAAASFVRSRPLYDNIAAEDWVDVALKGVLNDRTMDQTGPISDDIAVESRESRYSFPQASTQVMGCPWIYPEGSIIVGSGWSQIRAAGPFFSTVDGPSVVVQVGFEETGATVRDLRHAVHASRVQQRGGHDDGMEHS